MGEISDQSEQVVGFRRALAKAEGYDRVHIEQANTLAKDLLQIADSPGMEPQTGFGRTEDSSNFALAGEILKDSVVPIDPRLYEITTGFRPERISLIEQWTWVLAAIEIPFSEARRVMALREYMNSLPADLVPEMAQQLDIRTASIYSSMLGVTNVPMRLTPLATTQAWSSPAVPEYPELFGRIQDEIRRHFKGSKFNHGTLSKSTIEQGALIRAQMTRQNPLNADASDFLPDPQKVRESLWALKPADATVFIKAYLAALRTREPVAAGLIGP